MIVLLHVCRNLNVAYVVGPPVASKNYVFRLKSQLVHCRRQKSCTVLVEQR